MPPDLPTLIAIAAAETAACDALNVLTQLHTPFDTFRELVQDGGVFSFLRSRAIAKEAVELRILADAYDMARELVAANPSTYKWLAD